MKGASYLGESGRSRNDLGVSAGQFVSTSGRTESRSERYLRRDGAHVLPGYIDLHVHFDEPGRSEWEGITRGSIKAVLGGTTVVLDMPIDSTPPTISGADVTEKLALFSEKSYVDFGVFAGSIPGRTNEMEKAREAGAVGFKGFISPSGWDDFPPLDEEALALALSTCVRLGATLAVHAEDASLFRPLPNGPPQRTKESEVSAVEMVGTMASSLGAKVHFVHLSSQEAVRAARRFANATSETCPHYFLSDELASRFGFSQANVHPPVRDDVARVLLRDLVARQEVDVIASDHSPGPPPGDRSYPHWAGALGVGKTLLAVLEEFNSPDLVAHYVARAATVFGLVNKGSIRPGKDGDFVVVDRSGNGRWRILDVVLRGELVVEEGKLCGLPSSRNVVSRKMTN